MGGTGITRNLQVSLWQYALKPTLINPNHNLLLTKGNVFLLLNIYSFIYCFNHNLSITSHISFTKYKKEAFK